MKDAMDSKKFFFLFQKILKFLKNSRLYNGGYGGVQASQNKAKKISRRFQVALKS